MTVYFADLDDYGKGADIDIYLNKYRLYFEQKYTVQAIIEAIHKHCESKNHIPKVADIKNILQPIKPEITQAEYVQACRAWEREGYHTFGCQHYDLKKAYEKQESDKRNQPQKIEYSNEMLEIASSAVKRFGNE